MNIKCSCQVIVSLPQSEAWIYRKKAISRIQRLADSHNYFHSNQDISSLSICTNNQLYQLHLVPTSFINLVDSKLHCTSSRPLIAEQKQTCFTYCLPFISWVQTVTTFLEHCGWLFSCEAIRWNPRLLMNDSSSSWRLSSIVFCSNWNNNDNRSLILSWYQSPKLMSLANIPLRGRAQDSGGINWTHVILYYKSQRTC